MFQAQYTGELVTWEWNETPYRY